MNKGSDRPFMGLTGIRTLVLAVAITALSLISPAASAGGEGSGLRGGGETVDLGQHPRLRDLVDQTVCRWKNAGQFFRKLKKTPDITSSIADVHWYLAGLFHREADRLKLCLTSRLMRVPTEDEEEGRVTVVMDSLGTRQLAIRLNDMIFLDEALFNALSPVDRSMTLIHEVGHSFIPIAADQRNSKVRSFVRAIHDNFVRRVSREEFALSLEMNEVQVVWDTNELDSFRREVATLLNPLAPEFSRLKALSEMGMERLEVNFWYLDHATVVQFAEPIYRAAYSASLEGDSGELRNLVARGVDPSIPFFWTEYGKRSLLDLVGEVASGEVLEILLTSGHQLGESRATTLMVRVLRGEIHTVDPDRLIALGARGDVTVTLRDPKIAANSVILSLFSASIQYGRFDVASRLLAHGISAETAGEGIVYLIHSLGAEANAFARTLMKEFGLRPESALPGGRIVLVECLKAGNSKMFASLLPLAGNPGMELDSHGTTLLMMAAESAKGYPFVKRLLADGRINVNDKDAFGRTAFDRAVDGKNEKMMALIASDPKFQYAFKKGSDPVVSAERAERILDCFIALGSVDAIEHLIASYPFNWFALYRRAEMAKLHGKAEVEAAIRKAMKRN